MKTHSCLGLELFGDGLGGENFAGPCAPVRLSLHRKRHVHKYPGWLPSSHCSLCSVLFKIGYSFAPEDWGQQARWSTASACRLAAHRTRAQKCLQQPPAFSSLLFLSWVVENLQPAKQNCKDRGGNVPCLQGCGLGPCFPFLFVPGAHWVGPHTPVLLPSLSSNFLPFFLPTEMLVYSFLFLREMIHVISLLIFIQCKQF